jgi:hypothetical protein
MRKLFDSIKELIVEIAYGIIYVIEYNVYNAAILLQVLIPYIMLYIGIELFKVRGSFQIGGEILIPFFLMFISEILKKYANKNGNGYSVPIPYKRFTEENEDGEVTIKQEEIQEVILYLSDVEKYLIKKGRL